MAKIIKVSKKPCEEISLIGQPGKRVIDAVSALSESMTFGRVRMAFAFASELGVRLFLEILSKSGSWNTAEKKCLIGFDYGLTQPEALNRLVKQGSFEIRTPANHTIIPGHESRSKAIFHPKVLLLDSSKRGFGLGIVSGSANLTHAGLTSNSELVLEYRAFGESARSAPVLKNEFNSWWNRHWRNAAPLTDKLLADYSNWRFKQRQATPGLFVDDEPSPSEISLANCLWIDAGFLSGGAQNQLELPQGTEAFFGVDDRSVSELELKLEHDHQSWGSWLKFWGNQVWRLRLPTAHEGLGRYAGTFISFKKTKESGVFELETTKAGSKAAHKWQKRSTRLGTLRITTRSSGGREYGWF